MIEFIGRIACFRLFGATSFVKSNSRPTQLELGKAAQTEFVICDHTIDVTYIRMRRGFMYLVAVMDWYSRYVVAWQLSNNLDGRFCLDVLDLALTKGKPDIFNTDQGAQFTALAFTSRLHEAEIRISMDGRGHALDNVFVERLWRTVKYEHIYQYDYATVIELEKGLDQYLTFYNYERPYQSLSYQTPAGCICRLSDLMLT